MLKLTNMIFFFNNPLNFVTTNFYLHTKMSIKTTPKTAITKRLTHCRPIEINLIFNKQPSSVDMNHFIVSINRKEKPMQIFTVVFFFHKNKNQTENFSTERLKTAQRWGKSSTWAIVESVKCQYFQKAHLSNKKFSGKGRTSLFREVETIWCIAIVQFSNRWKCSRKWVEE